MSDAPEGRAKDWERYRALLSLLARLQADARLQGKIDLSGVVQQTLLEAFQAARQLADFTEAQQVAWLREALAHNLNDEIRKLRTAKRDIRRERSLEARLDESASRLEQLLPATSSTPSRQLAREENMLRVAQALDRLPANQRQVIEEHHLARPNPGRGRADAGYDQASRRQSAPSGTQAAYGSCWRIRPRTG